MQRNYDVRILDDPTSTKFLDQGYLKCDVVETTPPFRTRHFLYCVHCSNLGSSSWFFEHRKKLVFVLSTSFIDNVRSSFSHYVNDIYSEVDYLFEEGSLFKHETRRGQTSSKTTSRSKHHSGAIDQATRQTRPRSPDPADGRDIFDADGDGEIGAGSTDSFSQHVDAIIQCFCDLCFSNPIFETDSILSACRFFDEQNGGPSMDETKASFLKAKVISNIMKNVFVRLSLTKTQMDVLNRFIKLILILVSPTNKSITDHIHAGYLSCLRDGARKVQDQEAFFEESFRSCVFFALAFDTALFGQDHVLSCIVKFTFEDKVTQKPLFFKVCDSSTGEELANFVFDVLVSKNVPFEKLSCVASDGAASMIGTTNGMSAHLRRLITRKYGPQHCKMESMWCFAHRLNLVIRDFQHVDYINSVIRFCDLFTAKRRAVCYKKWLREKSKDKFRKIPKPSETRWSFYRDVLDVLLSQIDYVEKFIPKDRDLVSFMTSAWHQMVTASDDGSPLFFHDNFILSHFRFAFFVLDRICSTNTQLHEKNIFLHQAWILIKNLREDFCCYLRKIGARSFASFEYLGDLSSDELLSFEVIIESFLLNLDIRFPCPSFSMDMKVAKSFIDQESHTIDITFVKDIQSRCPLLEMVGVFLFPDDFLRRRQINPLFINGQYPEIPLIAREILENENELSALKKPSQDEGKTNKTCQEITLFEVFKVIHKEKYPALWKLVLRALSFLPTTVGCEQSFSFLKRKMHQNMTKENAFNLCLASQRVTHFSFIDDNENSDQKTLAV